MRSLITGITGFAGSHLAEYLLNEKRQEVFGTIRGQSKTENIEHIRQKINLIECDIKDSSLVRKIIDEVKPDYIFHLAAQSFVPTSWHAAAETLITNIIGNLNILEAARDVKIDPIIQIAGSSEEYGKVFEDELPIKETNPLRPLSPYGVSKVSQDLLSYQYFMSYGLRVILTRAFNHTGPRRRSVFVTSNFALQIACIEKGLQEPVIYVGDLSAKRDFSDVRDIVKGYWLAVECGEPGEVYNICSGKTWSIKEVLDILLSLTKTKVKIRQDPSRLRPSDIPVLLGDCSKFTKATGWKPEIPLEKTLEDLLNYWREYLKVSRVKG